MTETPVDGCRHCGIPYHPMHAQQWTEAVSGGGPVPGADGEPLAAQLVASAFGLADVPAPGRSITDDQAAKVAAAAHLMLRASMALEEREKLLDREAARRERTDGVLLAVVFVLVMGAVFFAVAGSVTALAG